MRDLRRRLADQRGHLGDDARVDRRLVARQHDLLFDLVADEDHAVAVEDLAPGGRYGDRADAVVVHRRGGALLPDDLEAPEAQHHRGEQGQEEQARSPPSAHWVGRGPPGATRPARRRSRSAGAASAGSVAAGGAGAARSATGRRNRRPPPSRMPDGAPAHGRVSRARAPPPGRAGQPPDRRPSCRPARAGSWPVPFTTRDHPDHRTEAEPSTCPAGRGPSRAPRT